MDASGHLYTLDAVLGKIARFDGMLGGLPEVSKPMSQL